jgi:hypothetical protein
MISKKSKTKKGKAKPSILQIIRILSDAKTLTLFKTIALGDDNNKGEEQLHQQYPNSDTIFIAKTNLTQKQFRISKLISVGLIKTRNEQNGQQQKSYYLTKFGKKVFENERIIEDAINAYCKLKALKISRNLIIDVVNSITDSFLKNSKTNGF